MKLHVAIGQFAPFKSAYEKLSGGRLPDNTVVGDQLVQSGIEEGDRKPATDIFLANLRFIGLVQPVSGSDHVMGVEDIPQQQLSSEPARSTPTPVGQNLPPTSVTPPVIRNTEPTVHLDIQIHIDSTASSQQIEQIFASMAKHLYGKEG